MRRIRRGGAYLRIADPAWVDPLDASYSMVRGGRWNPPESFPVLYLNRDLLTARANLERKFAGRPYGPETLDPAQRPRFSRLLAAFWAGHSVNSVMPGSGSGTPYRSVIRRAYHSSTAMNTFQEAS